MRTECSRNCWIAGGVGGLLVCCSVALLGESGWLAGLVLGLLAALMLGGLLVWGLCQGAGNSADNEALLAGGWRDEPFTPIRRVVSAGGEVVSQEPLALAERIPGAAPLDSRTVTPTRAEGDGGEGAAPAVTQGGGGQAAGESRSEAGAGATPRPRIVAGAGPDAPVQPQAVPAPAAPPAGTPAEPSLEAATSAPQAEAEAATDDPAHLQPAPGATAQAAHPTATPVEGMVLEEPEVRGSGSEALALDSTGFVEPRTDSEAGADPRAQEGGITPLAAADDGGPRPEERGAPGEPKGKHGKKAKPAKQASPNGAAAAPGAGGADADDLTRIRGVGPMLQTWLAGYGVTRLEQIAAWDDADIARFAGMMGRMGHRIRGEDWVGQARLLAAGGETAHSHAVDTGEAG